MRSTMRLPATRTCFSAIWLPWPARQQFAVPLPILFAAVLRVPLIPFAPAAGMRQGIPSRAEKKLDVKVSIEMANEFDSLNVSVAGAILMDRMR